MSATLEGHRSALDQVQHLFYQFCSLITDGLGTLTKDPPQDLHSQLVKLTMNLCFELREGR